MSERGSLLSHGSLKHPDSIRSIIHQYRNSPFAVINIPDAEEFLRENFLLDDIVALPSSQGMQERDSEWASLMNRRGERNYHTPYYQNMPDSHFRRLEERWKAQQVEDSKACDEESSDSDGNSKTLEGLPEKPQHNFWKDEVGPIPTPSLKYLTPDTLLLLVGRMWRSTQSAGTPESVTGSAADSPLNTRSSTMPDDAETDPVIVDEEEDAIPKVDSDTE